MSLNSFFKKTFIFQGDIQSADDLSQVIQQLKNGLTTRSCVLLKGDLAAGKTTFVQKFCESYGITSVSSPTFSLHHEYKNTGLFVDHFDLYRLTSVEEIDTCGLWESFDKPSGLIFIEWPERISENELPKDWDYFELNLKVKNENERFISLCGFFR